MSNPTSNTPPPLPPRRKGKGSESLNYADIDHSQLSRGPKITARYNMNGQEYATVVRPNSAGNRREDGVRDDVGHQEHAQFSFESTDQDVSPQGQGNMAQDMENAPPPLPPRDRDMGGNKPPVAKPRKKDSNDEASMAEQQAALKAQHDLYRIHYIAKDAGYLKDPSSMNMGPSNLTEYGQFALRDLECLSLEDIPNHEHGLYYLSMSLNKNLGLIDSVSNPQLTRAADEVLKSHPSLEILNDYPTLNSMSKIIAAKEQMLMDLGLLDHRTNEPTAQGNSIAQVLNKPLLDLTFADIYPIRKDIDAIHAQITAENKLQAQQRDEDDRVSIENGQFSRSTSMSDMSEGNISRSSSSSSLNSEVSHTYSIASPISSEYAYIDHEGMIMAGDDNSVEEVNPLYKSVERTQDVSAVNPIYDSVNDMRNVMPRTNRSSSLDSGIDGVYSQYSMIDEQTISALQSNVSDPSASVAPSRVPTTNYLVDFRDKCAARVHKKEDDISILKEQLAALDPTTSQAEIKEGWATIAQLNNDKNILTQRVQDINQGTVHPQLLEALSIYEQTSECIGCIKESDKTFGVKVYNEVTKGVRKHTGEGIADVSRKIYYSEPSQALNAAESLDHVVHEVCMRHSNYLDFDNLTAHVVDEQKAEQENSQMQDTNMFEMPGRYDGGIQNNSGEIQVS